MQVPGDSLKQVRVQKWYFRKIISELGTLKQPRFIVVDNFRDALEWNQKKKVGDILRRLAILSHTSSCNPPCQCGKAVNRQSKDINSTDEAAYLRTNHTYHW